IYRVRTRGTTNALVGTRSGTPEGVTCVGHSRHRITLTWWTRFRRSTDHRGREKDRYFRRVSVSVTTTLPRPPAIARAAALAFRSLSNNPNTADPLPDIAA